MAKDIIFVTGFFGTPVKETAEQVAMEKGFDLLSLDDEIERSDGRSILRICMIMGEHEYRNKEYEMLVKLTGAAEAGDSGRGVVIYCGDGVLNDEMSRQLISDHQLIIAGENMTPLQLWENARTITDSPHAFMHFGDEETKKQAFMELLERQRRLLGTSKNGKK